MEFWGMQCPSHREASCKGKLDIFSSHLGEAGRGQYGIKLSNRSAPPPNLPKNGGGISSPPVLGGVRGGRGVNDYNFFNRNLYHLNNSG